MLREYTSWKGVPEASFDSIVRLGVVLDEVIEEYGMDAIALRCWIEMQQQLGHLPLRAARRDERPWRHRRLRGGRRQRGDHARALAAPRASPPTCLDWNNNYGDDEDKCILFHCGPVPPA